MADIEIPGEDYRPENKSHHVEALIPHMRRFSQKILEDLSHAEIRHSKLRPCEMISAGVAYVVGPNAIVCRPTNSIEAADCIETSIDEEPPTAAHPNIIGAFARLFIKLMEYRGFMYQDNARLKYYGRRSFTLNHGVTAISLLWFSVSCHTSTSVLQHTLTEFANYPEDFEAYCRIALEKEFDQYQESFREMKAHGVDLSGPWNALEFALRLRDAGLKSDSQIIIPSPPGIDPNLN